METGSKRSALEHLDMGIKDRLRKDFLEVLLPSNWGATTDPDQFIRGLEERLLMTNLPFFEDEEFSLIKVLYIYILERRKAACKMTIFTRQKALH